ncbi:MAG: cadherin-like domain-containing protein [Armatimonadetes bacterium]|nr:cadherin-like domain-containing protein [Armatimonadota bacterium]
MKTCNAFLRFLSLIIALAAGLCTPKAWALDPIPTPGTGDGLTGAYFSNIHLNGEPALRRIDPVLHFDWFSGPPAPELPADGFSVRWTGQIQPQHSETYTFTTYTDDGVRLWVNGQLLIDDWTDHPPKENSGAIALEAGKKYDIKIEYFELHMVAVAQLIWSSPSTPRQIVPRNRLYSPSGNRAPVAQSQTYSVTRNKPFSFSLSARDSDGDPLSYVIVGNPAHGKIQGTLPHLTYTPNTGFVGTDTFTYKVNDGKRDSNTATITLLVTEEGVVHGLTGSYYPNRELDGTPLRRIDPTVNFDWGAGSPHPEISPDNFSVRWKGQVQPPASAVYTFITTTDDGVRLWVNGELIIDQWIDQPPREHSGSIALYGGVKYDIRMEYYERMGGALARLEWSSDGLPRQVIPQNRLFTRTSDEVDDEGPDISEEEVTPALLPYTGGSVTLRARVTDESGVRNVGAKITAPNGSTFTIPMTRREGSVYTGTLHVPGNFTGVPQVYKVEFVAADLKGNVTSDSEIFFVRVPPRSEIPFTVTPSEVTLRSGESRKFSASVAPVTWSVEGGIHNGTITSEGVYKAPPSSSITAPRNVRVVATDRSGRKAYAVVHLVVTSLFQPTLTVKPVTAKSGGTADVEIFISESLSFNGFAGIQFSLEYPTTVTTLGVADLSHPVEITFPDPILMNATISVNVTSPGVVRVAAASTRNSTRGGRFVRIPLKVKADAAPGVYPLHLVNARMFDEQNREIPVRIRQGTLTVIIAACGDTDLNGETNVTDALMALQSVVGLVTLNADQKRAADTDSNGEVTAGDVVKILRLAIKLDESCSGPIYLPIPAR